jgi:hypothetical protein
MKLDEELNEGPSGGNDQAGCGHSNQENEEVVLEEKEND